MLNAHVFCQGVRTREGLVALCGTRELAAPDASVVLLAWSWAGERLLASVRTYV